MTQGGMDIILGELQYLRTRLDGHIGKDADYQRCVQKQLTDISVNMSTHNAVVDTRMKGFVALISGVVSMIVASIGWAVTRVFGT